jgi:F-type H+-transporting ATPase subunit a
MRAPTADWSVAFGYALGTFFCIQVMGFKHRKGKYLKSFFEPIFLFFPLNVISELSRPIALSFRLFGNLLVGLIMMTLVHELLPILLRLFVPATLGLYFDIISGAMQTYIFCMLSITFAGSAAAENQG